MKGGGTELAVIRRRKALNCGGWVLTSDLAWNAVSPFSAAIDIFGLVEVGYTREKSSLLCSGTVQSDVTSSRNNHLQENLCRSA